MKKILQAGPSNLALFLLVSFTAVFVGTAMRAQTNASTLYGCTSITNCTGAANIPILVDSTGHPQVVVSGGKAVPTGVATGSVLASSGVGLSPVYSATPSLTSVLFPIAGSSSIAANSTTGVKITPADGGAYFFVNNGTVTVNSADLVLANGATAWTKTTPIADGLFNIKSGAGTVGPQFNVGTAAPTIQVCGTGTVTNHSSNFAGEVTATGATTCSVNFGLPNFTNAPFCMVSDETTLGGVRLTGVTVSAFTVVLTSGDKFTYSCPGGV